MVLYHACGRVQTFRRVIARRLALGYTAIDVQPPYKPENREFVSIVHIQTLHTHRITTADQSLTDLLNRYLPAFADSSILVITSKIISILQQRVRPMATTDRQALIEQEADRFLPPSASRYHVTLTIKDQLLMPSAGVDESNADGNYVLWPADIQQVANTIRSYLCTRFAIQLAGVLITDSRPLPLRWGVTGVGIAHSGFRAVNDLIGQPDLFGRPLHMTKVNVMDGLAAAAVLAMGEGAEGTPLAIVRDLPSIHFQARNPTTEELQAMQIAIEDDLYAPLLTAVPWTRRA